MDAADGAGARRFCAFIGVGTMGDSIVSATAASLLTVAAPPLVAHTWSSGVDCTVAWVAASIVGVVVEKIVGVGNVKRK